MPEEFLFSLFQLVDSAFPVGGFSHSAGLEAAVHAGLVRPGDRAGLEAFLRSHALCVQQGQLFHMKALLQVATHAIVV